MDKPEPTLFDVVATTIRYGERRIMVERVPEAEAEAIIKIAVMRRGVEKEFFSADPTGNVKDG